MMSYFTWLYKLNHAYHANLNIHRIQISEEYPYQYKYSITYVMYSRRQEESSFVSSCSPLCHNTVQSSLVLFRDQQLSNKKETIFSHVCSADLCLCNSGDAEQQTFQFSC